MYLVVDGASKIGTGFILLQRLSESHPSMRFLIINAGASLLPPTKGEFSPMEAEAISLNRECTSCHDWLYYAQEIHLISDCSRILQMLNKNLCDIQNRRLQNVIERVQLYNFYTEHISGQSNKVCDALSRLCKSVAG